MKPGLPWSVKGVEPDAREAAKAAARRDGVTLGVWLNRTIYANSAEGAASPEETNTPPKPADAAPAADPTAVTAADLQRLNAPLIAAVRNIEQATSKLADRLAALEKSQQELTLAAMRDIASEAARVAAEAVGQAPAAALEAAPTAKEAGPKAPPPPPPSPSPAPRHRAPANDDAENTKDAVKAGGKDGKSTVERAAKDLPVPTPETEAAEDERARPSTLRRFAVWTLATAVLVAGLLYGYNTLFPEWAIKIWPSQDRTAATDAPPATSSAPPPPTTTGETVADAPPPAAPVEPPKPEAPALDPEDVALANSYRTEAEAGSAIAQYNLANLYADGKGVPQDDDQAAKWYLAAAEQDLPEAQYNLGVLHQLGRGVPQDTAQTLRWFFKAADEGNHIGAQHGLAVMYATGRGVTRDYAQAAKWFKRAAVQDHMDSKYNLGILYAQGLGVQADPGTAYVWFSLAAKQGDEEAARRRDDLKATLPSDDVAAADSFVESWQPGNDVSIAAAEPAEPEELTRDAVREAQRLLSRLGFEPGPADGVVGSRTERSVREFQEREGLPADGRISAALIDRLKQAAEG